jgi:uncharacterized RDD family membrane protein YckC
MNLDRFFAAMIDYALAIVAAFIVATRLARHGEVVSWTGAAITFFACYGLSEVLFGNTLGKLCCGLTVRSLSGEKPRRSQLLVRWVFRLLEVNPVFLGGVPAGLAIVFSSRRQRIGDMVADTVVVPRGPVR